MSARHKRAVSSPKPIADMTYIADWICTRSESGKSPNGMLQAAGIRSLPAWQDIQTHLCFLCHKVPCIDTTAELETLRNSVLEHEMNFFAFDSLL